MKTHDQIIFELLNIYPKLIDSRGFIFFGTLEKKPPYEMACYQSWRLVIEEDTEYLEAKRTIGYMLESLLENISVPSPHPHGYIKIENSLITLHWTTNDVVETMLDNIERVSKLKKHYGFLD
ncbi:hypothetical protein L4C42_00055 [Vibrio wakamikoensis]|jgi:hypothetical protein|uniref:hypothetical protein n=1 Tax=Vibrio wakamikoensis TaxID=2910251 RepID=UPI003D2339FE